MIGAEKVMETKVQAFTFELIGDADRENELGDSWTRYHVVKADYHLLADLSDTWETVLTEMVQTHFPATRCMHEYDCCGNIYRNAGEILIQKWGDGDFRQAVVSQRHYRNV